MDNRRPTGTNPDKTYNRNTGGGYYKKNGDNSYQQREFQPRDNRFQSTRDNRFGPKSDERFRSRDERTSTPNPDSKYQPRENRDNRFQPRGDRFQPRDNRFQPRDRDDRFQSRDRDDRFQSRGPSSNGGGRFPRRDDRPADNRGERFPARKNFTPRNPSFRGKPTPPWKSIEKPKIYDEMQITDGKHIGKFLKKSDSPKVRPTARRVREAMFKMVFRKVRAGRFLDLCAGGGTVGIEAISRGALVCSFVERSAKMCAIIKKNLDELGIKQGHGEIFEIEAVPFLKQMSKRRRFWDVVFFDPPYDTNYDEVLSYLSRGVALKQGGTLVMEHHSEMFFPEKLGVLHRWRVVVLGDTTLSFYDRK